MMLLLICSNYGWRIGQADLDESTQPRKREKMRIATLRFVGDVHGETIKMELSRNEHVFPGSAGGAVRPPAPPGSALGESTSALRFLASLSVALCRPRIMD